MTAKVYYEVAEDLSGGRELTDAEGLQLAQFYGKTLFTSESREECEDWRELYGGATFLLKSTMLATFKTVEDAKAFAELDAELENRTCHFFYPGTRNDE